MTSSPLANDVDEEEAKPQKRRPLIAGTGWLLFICAFLPTLRVCGDPMTPLEFPPGYVAYLGAGALAILAVIRSLRARRAWFTVWFVLWFGTAITWASLVFADTSPIGSLFVVAGGLVAMVLSAVAFHRRRFTARGMYIGAMVHGAASTLWYTLLSGDRDAMWGAFVGLAASAAFTVASGIALQAEVERRRRERTPAPLPIARIV